MSVPMRIQRKRTKGWRMPPNTIAVTRPTLYGNPFTAADGYDGGPVVAFEHYLCADCKPCHADVLGQIANHEVR